MADSLKTVIKAIKSLKIQGAQATAEAALLAWARARNKKRAAKALIAARPTEPMLANAIYAVLAGIDPYELIERFRREKVQIAKIGARLIKDGMVIFTHCHSSTVVEILKEAKRHGKKFEVHNTETRPLFQGRITARELAKAGIQVHHYIDSAAMQAMRKADIFLFGADAITFEGVYNKIGTKMFAEVAATYFKIPVYSCSHSWKYSPKSVKIEQRPSVEVWPRAPRGVCVYNPAFEVAEWRFIRGLVCEHGILDKSAFLKIMKSNPYIAKRTF